MNKEQSNIERLHYTLSIKVLKLLVRKILYRQTGQLSFEVGARNHNTPSQKSQHYGKHVRYDLCQALTHLIWNFSNNDAN